MADTEIAFPTDIAQPGRSAETVQDGNGFLTRRATLAPATADPEARTVEVVWSTGAPVRRRDMAGPYIERLSLAPEAVDLSRLEGASVLDAHRQTAVRDVLGSVRSAGVDGKRGTALIQFSARPEVEPVWQDVLAGILRHVSVGYSVEEWAETTENSARVLTAVRWTPHEISLVPTPADPGAHIRMETEMTDTTTTRGPARGADHRDPRRGERGDPLHRPHRRARPVLDRRPDRRRRGSRHRPARGLRGAGEAIRAVDPHGTGPRRDGREPGRPRAPRPTDGRGALRPDQPAPRAFRGPARRYAYSTPVDMAKELLTLRGESTMALSPASLVDPRPAHHLGLPHHPRGHGGPRAARRLPGRALGHPPPRPPDHGAGFPCGEQDHAGRGAAAGEAERATAKSRPGPWPRHGRPTRSRPGRGRSASPGRCWSTTTSAPSRTLPRRMGQAAAETEARILVTLLEASSGNGPTLSDGKTLFHADQRQQGGHRRCHLGCDALGRTAGAAHPEGHRGPHDPRDAAQTCWCRPRWRPRPRSGWPPSRPATAADVNPFSGSLSLVVEPAPVERHPAGMSPPTPARSTGWSSPTFRARKARRSRAARAGTWTASRSG